MSSWSAGVAVARNLGTPITEASTTGLAVTGFSVYADNSAITQVTATLSGNATRIYQLDARGNQCQGIRQKPGGFGAEVFTLTANNCATTIGAAFVGTSGAAAPRLAAVDAAMQGLGLLPN